MLPPIRLTCLGCLSLLLACAGDPPSGEPPKPAGPPVPAAFATGRGVFEEKCAGCHGDTGGGSEFGPSLLTFPDEATADARISRALYEGIPMTPGSAYRVQGMPRMQLRSNEEGNLRAYLRWLRSTVTTPTPPSPAVPAPPAAP